MGYVSYHTCDICNQRIDDPDSVRDGEVSIHSGQLSILLCVSCQETLTVKEAKDRLRGPTRIMGACDKCRHAKESHDPELGCRGSSDVDVITRLRTGKDDTCGCREWP